MGVTPGRPRDRGVCSIRTQLSECRGPPGCPERGHGLVAFGPELLQAPSPSPGLLAAPALWEQVTVGAGGGDMGG